MSGAPADDAVAQFISSMNSVVPAGKKKRIRLPEDFNALRVSQRIQEEADGNDDEESQEQYDRIQRQIIEEEEEERKRVEQERKEEEEKSNKRIEWINDPSSEKIPQWLQLIDLFPTLDPKVLAHVLETQKGSLESSVETILGKSEADLLSSLHESDDTEDDEWNGSDHQDLNQELRNIFTDNFDDSSSGSSNSNGGSGSSSGSADGVSVDDLSSIPDLISSFGSPSSNDDGFYQYLHDYSPAPLAPPLPSSSSSSSSSSSYSPSSSWGSDGSADLAPPLDVPEDATKKMTREEIENLRREFDALPESEKRKLNRKRQELLHRKLTNQLEVGMFWKILGYSDIDFDRETEALKHLEVTDTRFTYDPTPQRTYLSYTQRNLDIMTVQSFGSTVRNIVNPRLAERFNARMLKFQAKYGVDSKEAKPVLAFHGTRAHNVDSIIDKGLIIPGWFNGIKKANGSVYGTGIYCSPSASYAASYASGGRLFVLAVLQGKTTTGSVKLFHDSRIAISDQIWVIFRPSQVLPLYVIG